MERIHEDIVACYLYIITKHGYPPDDTAAFAHLDEFARLGFTGIELEGIREAHLDGIFLQRNSLASRVKELGLKVPVFCAVLPGLSSPDGKEREENLERLEKGCITASALGARALLDNAPLPPWKFPEGIPVTRHYDEEVLSAASLPVDLSWESYWDGLVETFREACDMAARHGLSYQVHPCYGALVNSTDAFLLFADAVKRDNLKFNLDTANQFFMKDQLFLSLIRLKDRIDYIHVSDNRGVRVEHLGIGDGRIDWERFLETLDRIGYSGSFGIDIGGDESDVPDLDGAYRSAAGWLTEYWFGRK
jgi:sugar phosphate isomerase/epimerase